jgi:acyl carrier protein
VTQVTEDKLYRVLSQVFGVPAAQITDDSSPDTLSTWDSMSHLNMVVALEAEFGVQLTPEQAMEMLSVRLVRMTLQELGVQDFK